MSPVLRGRERACASRRLPSPMMVGALGLATFFGAAPASATDLARTAGFVFGSVSVVRSACKLSDDPDGLGRVLVGARLEKADILPGGARRTEFQAGAEEARLHLTAKLNRDGREPFCSFALQRYGPTGLRVVRR